MEHSYIVEHNITDLYLLGKLSTEERMRFEEHCENCRQCLDWLETIDGLRRGLRIVAGEEAWRTRVYAEAGLLARVARLSRVNWAALLAGVVLLIALPLGLLVLELSRARRDLAQAAGSAAEWRRKYEERAQTERDLMKETQVREWQSSARQDRAPALAETKQEDRIRQNDEVKKAESSQTTMPVFALSVARGGDVGPPQPVNRIKISSASELIVLLLELGPDTDFQSYRAAISTAGGRRIIWRWSRLKPSYDSALALIFNSGLFKPGNYLLTLEGLTAQKRYVLAARYNLRVVTQ